MSLTGQIKRINDVVSCDVLNCTHEAKFSWFFQSEDNTKLSPLHGENIVAYVGMGKYICKVVCGEVSAVYSAFVMDGTIQENVYAPIAETQYIESKVDVSVWDFSKLPNDKVSVAQIKEHVKNEDWRQLAIIHNNYQLSPKTICCDMSEVKKNFVAYVENLPARKGKVVEGNK